ncbi:MAG: PEGA domain-containing protein [Deltaproteobacteria bacterium]|nr:PEGA domain-containing protein [Deltaproteobacteria bacterium]
MAVGLALLGLGRPVGADIQADVPAREWLRRGGAVLVLDVVPKQARIEIDGDVKRDGPWLVTAGVHLVVASAPGRQTFREVLRVPAGRRTMRRIDLRAQPVMGHLDVRTTPRRARLIIDGRLRGETPRVVELAAGRHRLLVAALGYRSARRVVRVPRAATLTIRITLLAERRRFRRPRLAFLSPR